MRMDKDEQKGKIIKVDNNGLGSYLKKEKPW